MKIYVPLYQFILLALSTALITYFFNSSLMAGQLIMTAFWGGFLLRNLYAAYQLSRFARIIEEQTKHHKGKQNKKG